MARTATSVTVSTVASLASLMSPPATIDCSGSHWRTVAFSESVLMEPRASAPPWACTARPTRSAVLGCIEAQATTTSAMTSERARVVAARVIGPPWGESVIAAQYRARLAGVNRDGMPRVPGWDRICAGTANPRGHDDAAYEIRRRVPGSLARRPAHLGHGRGPRRGRHPPSRDPPDG